MNACGVLGPDEKAFRNIKDVLASRSILGEVFF